jgi:histidinol-phosphate aminotransferase
MDATLNRRTWLKQTALTAGGVIAGLTATADLFAKPAFGMMPLNGLNFTEDFVLSPAQETIKARLLANENPWGPSKSAIAAIAESATKGNRYVYSSSLKMVEVLAEKEGVTTEHVLLAAGSTDILEKTAFALCRKGGNVISADPSYLSLVKTAQAIGAAWKNIPLRADYAHDLDAMEKSIDADTKLIYLCNPNNPTGTLTPIEEIKAFVKKVNSRVPVFIDEAYLELLDKPESQTAVGLINEGYDVIVCRTFSKIHGMAGLRIGYMVAKPERVKEIQSLVRTEMGISVTSLEGSMASLNDIAFQHFSRQKIKEGREFTFAELTRLGFTPIPSVTNFILFPIRLTTREFVAKMADLGVGIRGFDIHGKPFGRVSIGTPDELKLFIKSISTLAS